MRSESLPEVYKRSTAEMDSFAFAGFRDQVNVFEKYGDQFANVRIRVGIDFRLGLDYSRLVDASMRKLASTTRIMGGLESLSLEFHKPERQSQDIFCRIVRGIREFKVNGAVDIGKVAAFAKCTQRHWNHWNCKRQVEWCLCFEGVTCEHNKCIEELKTAIKGDTAIHTISPDQY